MDMPSKGTESELASALINLMPTPTPVSDEKQATDNPPENEGSESVKDPHTDPTSAGTVPPLTEGRRDPFVVDARGTPFDSGIHACDSTGQPIKKADGTFAKKRGRKAGGTNAVAGPKGISGDRAMVMMSAAATVNAIFTFGMVLGGEEWRPIVKPEEGIDEPRIMMEAWVQYFTAAGVTNIPPWLGVLIATSGYALPRCTMPKTRSKLAVFGGWIRGVFTRRKK